jgi:hypothetical protein
MDGAWNDPAVRQAVRETVNPSSSPLAGATCVLADGPLEPEDVWQVDRFRRLLADRKAVNDRYAAQISGRKADLDRYTTRVMDQIKALDADRDAELRRLLEQYERDTADHGEDGGSFSSPSAGTTLSFEETAGDI